MESKELLRLNLETSMGVVLKLIDDLKDAPLTFPTSNGGCHPLWILGHLAYSEETLIREWMLGEENPLGHWKDLFNMGTEAVDDVDLYPPYSEVLEKCQEARAKTLALLGTFSEEDLDRPSKNAPPDFEKFFSTYRLCFQMVANHWWMHRGQVADSRRAAGRPRFGP